MTDNIFFSFFLDFQSTKQSGSWVKFPYQRGQEMLEQTLYMRRSFVDQGLGNLKHFYGAQLWLDFRLQALNLNLNLNCIWKLHSYSAWVRKEVLQLLPVQQSLLCLTAVCHLDHQQVGQGSNSALTQSGRAKAVKCCPPKFCPRVCSPPSAEKSFSSVTISPQEWKAMLAAETGNKGIRQVSTPEGGQKAWQSLPLESQSPAPCLESER